MSTSSRVGVKGGRGAWSRMEGCRFLGVRSFKIGRSSSRTRVIVCYDERDRPQGRVGSSSGKGLIGLVCTWIIV